MTNSCMICGKKLNETMQYNETIEKDEDGGYLYKDGTLQITSYCIGCHNEINLTYPVKKVKKLNIKNEKISMIYNTSKNIHYYVNP